jgi:hypothetical protein
MHATLRLRIDDSFSVLDFAMRVTEDFILHTEYFNVVIELGMGKDSKKKPLSKKEREEKRKKRKEKSSK